MTTELQCPAGRVCRVRGWAALWALVASGFCAAALWYHVSVVQEHEQALHKVLEYAPEAVVVCDEHGRVIYANDAIKTVTGFTEADLVAGGVEQIIPAELRAAHNAAFQRALLKVSRGIEGVNYQRIMPVQCKNGGLVVCLVTVGTVRQNGHPHFFAFVAPAASGTPTPAKDTNSGPAPWKSPTLEPDMQLTEK